MGTSLSSLGFGFGVIGQPAGNGAKAARARINSDRGGINVAGGTVIVIADTSW